jgi:hypothetical protein
LTKSQQKGTLLQGLLNDIFGPEPLAETAAKVGMIIMGDVEVRERERERERYFIVCIVYHGCVVVLIYQLFI